MDEAVAQDVAGWTETELICLYRIEKKRRVVVETSTMCLCIERLEDST